MAVNFTKEEREHWIKFCKGVAEDFNIEHPEFEGLTDEELDKTADWFWELTGK